MKRLLIGTLLALTVATAYLAIPLGRASASDYGPGSSGIMPVYTQPVHVVDVLVTTLREDHRAAWRSARDAALAAWTTGCVSFTVTRGTEAEYGTWDSQVGVVGFAALGLSRPDTIVIYRNRDTVRYDEGGYENGGVVVMSPWIEWFRDARNLTGTIGHEVGHALGFGHGGTGIMVGTNRPSAEDLEVLRAYYC